MYVRLAFAVAAHLESEIMIVDEVLAVGDAEFQKKCLGKMGDVSRGEGRTVLFVSHNMGNITALCNNCILLNDGNIEKFDTTENVITQYLSLNTSSASEKSWKENNPGNQIVKLISIKAIDQNSNSKKQFDITQPVGVEMEYEVFEENNILWHGLNLYNDEGVNIFDTHSVTSEWYNTNHPIGKHKITAWIPGNLLNEGRITISAAIFNHTTHQIHLHAKEVITFEVIDFLDEHITSARGKSTGKFPGIVRPLLNWTHSTIR